MADMKLVVNCLAAGIKSQLDEAAAMEEHADLLQTAGRDDDARMARRRASDHRSAARKALTDAGYDPDGPSPPIEQYVELTKEEVAQRVKDAQTSTDAQWGMVRAQRDALLAKSDWTDLPNAQLTEPQKAAWALYRTALRDLPSVIADPYSVTWPELPK